MKQACVLLALIGLCGCGGGSMSTPSPMAVPAVKLPNLPTNWTATDLPPLPNANAAQANAVNVAGRAVGYSVNNGLVSSCAAIQSTLVRSVTSVHLVTGVGLSSAAGHCYSRRNQCQWADCRSHGSGWGDRWSPANSNKLVVQFLDRNLRVGGRWRGLCSEVLQEETWEQIGRFTKGDDCAGQE